MAAAAALGFFVVTPMFAQGQTQSTRTSVPATNTNVGDPNEKICENIIPIGSRIATKRFCGTRAEWADRKRQDREALERAQLSPCVLTHTVVGANGNGHPSC
jgi:hypothetical protein